MKMVTQTEVARRLGISRSAVAKAFHPTLQVQLSPQRRQLILKTAEQLGYAPNHAARRMARSRFASRNTSFDQVGLISFVDPTEYMDLVCHAMMSGAEYELSKLHASLTFVRVSEESDWDKVERLTRSGGMDGWLLYGGRVDDEIVSRFKPFNLPFVVIGDHQCTQPVHSVNIDHAAVGRLAVKHLASLGHRRIAILHGDVRFAYQQQTVQGFRAALKELGMDDDERLLASYRMALDPRGGPLIEWLRSTGPTAIFAAEPDFALKLYHLLRQSQLEVPKDISLLAYQVGASAMESQDFTRIELPMAGVGRQGALLLRRATLEPGLGSTEIKLSPSLIEEWSCCPPHGAEGNDNETRLTN